MTSVTSPLPSSDGSASDSTSNRLALAAAILAAGAFVVAFMQALLEYISSNSAMRKCSPCAIGYSSYLVKRRWNFRFWKLRVYYPLLALEKMNILNVLFIQSLQSIELDDGISEIAALNSQWAWRNINEDDVPKWLQVADEMTVLCHLADTSKIISISDIPWVHWKLRLAFLKWRWNHPLQPNRRPRASWAQLLFAFGITETKALMNQLVDADMIPSNLDVPLQRIGLFDLGVLAFLMGFTSVKIDIPNRDFRAISSFGTITTQELQGWGKIIHFDGDAREFHQLLARCAETWLYRGSSLINGNTSYGKYQGNSLALSVDILGDSIKNKRSIEDHKAEVFERSRGGIFDRSGIERDNTWEEASLMNRLVNDLINSLLQSVDQVDHPQGNIGDTKALDDTFITWQVATGKCVPSLLLSASFMTIHGIVCGFPSDALLEPISAWSRYRAQKLWARRPFFMSKNLRRSMVLDLGGFFRVTSDYLMSREVGASPAGLYGWGISTMKIFFDYFPEELRLEIVSSDGLAAAVLTAETSALIENFNPREWATQVKQSQVESYTSTLFKPLNVLWCQIIVLDIAIQYHIRRGWDNRRIGQSTKSPSPPGSRAAVLSKALAAATSPKPDVSRADGKGLQRRVTTLSEAVAANPPETNRTEEESTMDRPEEPTKANDTRSVIARLFSKLLHCEDWYDQEGQVAYAISRSLEIPTDLSNTKTFHEWNLESSLKEHSGITTGANGEELRGNYFGVLADLLELRGLFVIAFLNIHPDSTDVYNAESENIQMPIA
ncbi:hypothetical protein GP486_005792 [Trichoglossum hirsutum]|uniref:Uncharacterized protein n=1 Tax=Trichoglossum hirsutum TaxID=265104 RepID=A0A9P8RM21_9PEZI|nr:hypothetical protein GP486_005792 [Trichoglossum hirsutum]